MVTLEQIRNDLEKLLQADKDLHFVEVHADTLNDALADAALQLDCRVSLLEYEVIEAGSDGFMGMMKKPWTIRAYMNASQVKKTAQEVEAPDRVAQVIDKVSRYALETGADVRLVETLYRQMIAGFIQLEHQVVKKRD